MAQVAQAPAFAESRIEDEPILGPVLVLPNGTIKALTFVERLLFRLHLVDAKRLGARYGAAH